MTENNMYTAAFDMQRTMIKQSHEATVDAIEAQKTAMDAMVEGVETAQSLGESNADFVKNAVHAYLDAVEGQMPEDAADFAEFREAFDEQFDAASEAQKDAFEAYFDALQDSNELFDEYADNYVSAVDTSFDSFLEAHEQAEESVEEIDVSAA